MAEATDDFRRQMLGMGIVSYREQDTLWDIGKKCAGSIGVATAGGMAVLGAGAGPVTIPVVGSMPGVLAGMGTCMAVNVRHRNALRQLLVGQ